MNLSALVTSKSVILSVQLVINNFSFCFDPKRCEKTNNIYFTFQKLQLKLNREDENLIITIHNLQKTKVNFIILMCFSVTWLSV